MSARPMRELWRSPGRRPPSRHADIRHHPKLVYFCPVLDRFDSAARRSVELAAVEARRLGHPHVGTEHLMLGLLAEGRNPAAMLLQSAGAPLAACREKVSEALARRDLPPAPRDASDLELTDRAARAIDRAGKLSLRMKSEYVGAAHLLTSILDVEGTAGQVLRGLNVDMTILREDLARITADPGAPSQPPRPEPGNAEESQQAAVEEAPANPTTHADVEDPLQSAEPVCGTCGAPLRTALAHAVLASDDGAQFDVAFCSSCGAGLGASARPSST